MQIVQICFKLTGVNPGAAKCISIWALNQHVLYPDLYLAKDKQKKKGNRSRSSWGRVSCFSIQIQFRHNLSHIISITVHEYTNCRLVISSCSSRFLFEVKSSVDEWDRTRLEGGPWNKIKFTWWYPSILLGIEWWITNLTSGLLIPKMMRKVNKKLQVRCFFLLSH